MIKTPHLFWLTLLISALLSSCENPVPSSAVEPVDWSSRRVDLPQKESMESGASYLSIYSEIYGQTGFRTFDLTATVSIRNTNRTQPVYIHKAEYYNTKGELIRTHFDKTIQIDPLETVEIVICETDQTGGTGANFLFDWSVDKGVQEPFFEAVMISTSGQLGLSFTTQGRRIE